LYTLIIRPNNTYSILIDAFPIVDGSLLTDFDPPIAPPETLPDPTDKKPADRDARPFLSTPGPPSERILIINTYSTKPPDWAEDEPELLPDATAVRPAYWDASVLGAWRPPAVFNRRFRGRFFPALEPNPRFVDQSPAPNPCFCVPWAPHGVRNTAFSPAAARLRPLTGAGFELWSANRELAFSRILIARDDNAVAAWNARDFLPRMAEQLAPAEEVAEEAAALCGAISAHPVRRW
jgi:hypothetical protein